jgi:cobalt/nickel transport system permease protein
MHIPDGFLSAPVAIACAALSTVAVGAAASRSRALPGSRAIALTGVTAAFVFSAQMLNFPVAGGTSGHLVGGVLAAVLLGPSAAVIAMTSVLAMQCFVFGDGGLLALGANVLNMAVVHPIVGFAVYSAIVGAGSSRAPAGNARRVAGLAFASWVATVVAAVTCAGELALSGVVAPHVVLPAMLTIHLAIGAGEALIAALVLATLLRLRPALVTARRPPALPVSSLPPLSSPSSLPRRSAPIVAMGLTVSLALAVFVSPFACKWPDGLERVAERIGLEPSRLTIAPLEGYVFPGLGGHFSTTSLAGALGTLLAFGLSCALGAWLASPSRS